MNQPVVYARPFPTVIIIAAAAFLWLAGCGEDHDAASESVIADSAAVVAQVDKWITEIDTRVAEIETRIAPLPGSSKEAVRSTLRDVMDERTDLVRLKEEVRQTVSREGYADVRDDLLEEYRDVDSLLARAEEKLRKRGS